MDLKWIFSPTSSFKKFSNTKVLSKWTPRFKGVYSRDNFPNKIKDESYVINLDKYANVGTHWIVLFVSNNDAICCDSFGVGHVSKEIKKFIGNKNMQTYIFRIQANNSIMWWYLCIRFIDFMLAGKNLIEYTSLFLPYDLKKKKKKITL